MTMTPEEIINKQTWEILQDIKEESLAPEEDGTFFYDTTITVIAAGENSPTREREWRIVRKLAREEKAIEIVKEVLPDWRGTRNGFYLKVLQPQFDKVYNKYEKACDLTTYLNDYQEKAFKGDDNLPEFGQIKNTDDKGKATPANPIKHKGGMFPTGSGGGYYNRNHPIRPMKKQSATEIVDGFSSSNYAFVLMVSEGVLSASEFGTDGEADYKLQSAPRQMLMQERQLLSKFEKLGLFRHLGEDGIFAIAKLRNVDTKTIEQIAAEIKSRQLNPQTKPEGKSADLKARYSQLLEEIRRSNESTQNINKESKEALNEIKEKNSPAVSSRNNTQKQENPTLPSGWELVEKNGEGQILENKKVWFIFPNLSVAKYLYFKYAWHNKYNQVVPYKELYESNPENKYPNKRGENWKINDKIRGTIRKLRNEFKNKEVPVVIETKNGIRVFVKK